MSSCQFSALHESKCNDLGGGGGGGLSFTIGVSTDVPILWVSFFSILVHRFGIKMTPFFPFSV